MYDLIVVGGGPAGLTATIYALRKRINVLLISKDLGGKTNYTLRIPWAEDHHVIRGLEVVDKFRRELEYLNFARHMEPVERIVKNGDIFTVYTKGGGELEDQSGDHRHWCKAEKADGPGRERVHHARVVLFGLKLRSALSSIAAQSLSGMAIWPCGLQPNWQQWPSRSTWWGSPARRLKTPLGEKLLSDKKVEILGRLRGGEVYRKRVRRTG